MRYVSLRAPRQGLPRMIPPILHQTWKNDDVPKQFLGWIESWSRHNPGWTRMFWNDRTLIEFVGEHYPDFLPTFCSYKQVILRADAGRYLLLHHFGGVYADLDCECVAPFDPIMAEDRVVLCREPPAHFPGRRCSEAFPICFSTARWRARQGILSGCISGLTCRRSPREGDDRRDGACRADLGADQLRGPGLAGHPSVQSLHAARPRRQAGRGGVRGAKPCPSHHWAGTWWKPQPEESLWNAFRRQIFRSRYLLTRGKQLDLAAGETQRRSRRARQAAAQR